MSERAALVEYLRMEFDRDNDSRDSEAADMLERDGAEIARLLRWQEDAVALCAKRQCGKRDQRIAELEADIAQVTERLHRREADLLAQMNTNIEVGNLLDAARAALADVSAAIGTNEFMDPPDGGSPSLADQVRRMRAALAEAQRDAARYRTLKSWYYAADFIYPDAGSVLIFQLPTQGTRVSASLDATIDAAQERSHASE